MHAGRRACGGFPGLSGRRVEGECKLAVHSPARALCRGFSRSNSYRKVGIPAPPLLNARPIPQSSPRQCMLVALGP